MTVYFQVIADRRARLWRQPIRERFPWVHTRQQGWFAAWDDEMDDPCVLGVRTKADAIQALEEIERR